MNQTIEAIKVEAKEYLWWRDEFQCPSCGMENPPDCVPCNCDDRQSAMERHLEELLRLVSLL